MTASSNQRSRRAAARSEALADAGAQYFIAGINGTDQQTMELLAETVWPRLVSAHGAVSADAAVSADPAHRG